VAPVSKGTLDGCKDALDSAARAVTRTTRFVVAAWGTASVTPPV